ncbi:hypothetical protein cce_3071 [Crocosphaera subtropica ATCC 51142]|uniref:Uncharacterized protein n=1 Tax=Crocosphaera subtropica (strain ATCC 51142 / BH68) TaxID=43989 RepID=B1WWV0_CROS5|nr:hypothetical protein cce_3071 [Crocosphaera subtropica ATCC 51142]
MLLAHFNKYDINFFKCYNYDALLKQSLLTVTG